jgi:hypothetical protein
MGKPIIKDLLLSCSQYALDFLFKRLTSLACSRIRIPFHAHVFFCFIPQLVYFHQKKYNKAMEVLFVDYVTTK